MSFDFSTLLAPKHVEVIIQPMLPALPDCIGRRMSESEILELWEERSAIIYEGNVELVSWCQSQEFTAEKTWRYVELVAAAELSIRFGTYVEAVIQPRIRAELPD